MTARSASCGMRFMRHSLAGTSDNGRVPNSSKASTVLHERHNQQQQSANGAAWAAAKRQRCCSRLRRSTRWAARAGFPWTSFPHLYEIQRPKSKADQEQIATTFPPYLRGRDWVSINNGEVVDFAASPCERVSHQLGRSRVERGQANGRGRGGRHAGVAAGRQGSDRELALRGVGGDRRVSGQPGCPG